MFESAGMAAQRRFSALEARQGDRCLIERIKGELHDLDRHVPTLREVASALAMSSRTLRRRLMDLGTSYSEILSDQRYQLAAEYLRDTSLTVDRIAERLGYTEVTNFRRAFRRWGGCPPCAFRQSARLTDDVLVRHAA